MNQRCPPSKRGSAFFMSPGLENYGDTLLNYGHLSFSVPVCSAAERGRRNSSFSPGFGHQGNIISIIIVAEKSLHGAVSPLRERMRYALLFDA
jgi:hypothetical protein